MELRFRLEITGYSCALDSLSCVLGCVATSWAKTSVFDLHSEVMYFYLGTMNM